MFPPPVLCVSRVWPGFLEPILLATHRGVDLLLPMFFEPSRLVVDDLVECLEGRLVQ
jgi:hypothetical protein